MSMPNRPTFAFVREDERDAILSAASRRHVAPDEIVFEQGVPMRAIYMIERGVLRVERVDRGASVPLSTMYEGDFFGEISFVDGEATSARVVAEESTDLLVIEPDAIGAVADRFEGFEGRFYRSLAAVLAQRLRLAEKRFLGDHSWG